MPSNNNSYDHCCFTGKFSWNIEQDSYGAALSMMRSPGRATWQVIDMTRHQAQPKPWNLSLYPWLEPVFAPVPLDLNGDGCHSVKLRTAYCQRIRVGIQRDDIDTKSAWIVTLDRA